METSRAVRPPQQARSRHSWDRVLTAGMWILENEGRDALTVSAVCERAQVTPMAIYRRVNGLPGLFWAIYDRGMSSVADTYDHELEQAALHPAGSVDRVDRVAAAVAETFERHTVFLHQIINYSTTDPELSRRGSEESLQLVDRVTTAARDVARMLHQECVFRAMYGERWLSHESEGFAPFVERLRRMARGRLQLAWRV
jgi:AcrR family transcriptional regulator